MPTPDGSVILLDGQGQDGNEVFAVEVRDRRLGDRKLWENAIAAAFAPGGDRLLDVPHPSFENRVRLLAWPSLQERASPSGDEEIGAFDLYGFFLGTDRIVLSRYDMPPLLCDASLRPLAALDLSSSTLGPDATAETLVALPPTCSGHSCGSRAEPLHRRGVSRTSLRPDGRYGRLWTGNSAVPWLAGPGNLDRVG